MPPLFKRRPGTPSHPPKPRVAPPSSTRLTRGAPARGTGDGRRGRGVGTATAHPTPPPPSSGPRPVCALALRRARPRRPLLRPLHCLSLGRRGDGACRAHCRRRQAHSTTTARGTGHVGGGVGHASDVLVEGEEGGGSEGGRGWDPPPSSEGPPVVPRRRQAKHFEA